MRTTLIGVLVGAGLLTIATASLAAQSPAEMDHDLIEITIPQLQRLYAEHKYTIAQVGVVSRAHQKI